MAKQEFDLEETLRVLADEFSQYPDRRGSGQKAWVVGDCVSHTAYSREGYDTLEQAARATLTRLIKEGELQLAQQQKQAKETRQHLATLRALDR